MKMLDFYKSILSTGGLFADSEGFISARIKDTESHFKIRTKLNKVESVKRLVLPTKEHLSNPDWSNRIVFHPLSENRLAGESDVLAGFRKAINVRLDYVLNHLLQDMMTIVTSVSTHSKLSPDQQELLSVVLKADEKTLIALQAIVKAMPPNSKDECVARIHLNRSGVIGGVKHSRAAIVSFPLYEELIKEDSKQVFGVTVRTKDRLAITQLLEFIFPDIKTPGSYNRGSNDDQAPFLDALMKAVMGVASCINVMCENYSGFITDSEDYIYNSDWVEVFDNLTQMLSEIRMVPMQAGNDRETTSQTAPVAVAQPTLQMPVLPAYAPAPPPAAYYQAPVQYQAPPPPVAHNGIVKTASGGIDLGATLRNDPTMMGQMHNGGYQHQPQQTHAQMNRNRPPVWAQPPQQSYGGYQPQMGYQQPMQMNHYNNNGYQPRI